MRTDARTYGRMCMKCGTFKQEIIRTLANGNLILRCPKCGKQAELSQTGHEVYHSQEAANVSRS